MYILLAGGILMKKPLIFQSDFGRVDGAVSAMYGVAYGVDTELLISLQNCKLHSKNALRVNIG